LKFNLSLVEIGLISIQIQNVRFIDFEILKFLDFVILKF